ncbi:MAG: c-type cytochrome [Planctomycetaceae bacterium]
MRSLRRAAWFAATLLVVGRPAAGQDSGPVVPGFARFHPSGDGDAGGRLLLGELNCTACHGAETPIADWIVPKPAPVLDLVSTRVRPAYLRRFLADPHAVDPGTTMPNVFAGVDDATREAQVEALVHFLATGGTVAELRSDPAAAKRGEKLFHTIGCAVCHGERKDDAAVLPTSVPLHGLSEKYGIPGLADFLRKPHDVRPGGRMPSLGLDEKQALDVAHFLVPDANPKSKDPRLTYKVYDGSFSNLPDFKTLQPSGEGQSDGFEVYVAGKDQDFAVAYEGFLKIDRTDEYWFLLASDDGSKLFIDGELVSNNDGVHAATTVRGAKKLEAGVHPIRVEYAQVAGEQKLSVQYEAPGVPRQPVADAVYLTAEATRLKPAKPESVESDDDFRLDPALAAKGRELFASLGCANCHRKRDGATVIASTKTAPSLLEICGGATASEGCLAGEPAVPSVDYELTANQSDAIRSAIETLSVQLAKSTFGPPSRKQQVDAALVRFNCYGCHERGGNGGVEAERNGLFETTVPEMGDEGRIPPSLNGVGDKLDVDWMKHLLGNGSTDRKYMRTRMPNFGSENVGFFAEAFASLDQRTEATYPTLDLPEHRVESAGRELVGESALSCIKCHNFGQYSGTGIQAIDLQTMTRRLRRDWFVRYMLDPQKYRPGTRMPSSFRPNNKSAVKTILDGASDRQLAAIWTYLDLGTKASIPAGVVHSSIILTATDRPILYRAFLEGLSPRGIAVGYPEKANLAFDADEMSLALIWHNDFIDASMHWEGRGNGFQRPLGDHVLSLVRGVPLAVLSEDATAWPAETAKEQGWRFLGYRLDKDGRPTFRYGTETFTVEDTPHPIDARTAKKTDAVLRRTLVISPASDAIPQQLYARIAAGKTIEPRDGGSYRIDEALTLRLLAGRGEPQAVIRDAEAGKELLVPIPAAIKPVRIELEYEW